MEKTDLTKIISVNGEHGLWRYIAQARNGAIVESLSTKERKCFDARKQISSLEDISIYTSEGEVKLKEVFLKMKDALGSKPCPSPKDSPETLKALFKEALPNYDEGRFYPSHMKKVVLWYDELVKYASLDFTDPEAEAKEEDGEQEAKDE